MLTLIVNNNCVKIIVYTIYICISHECRFNEASLFRVRVHSYKSNITASTSGIVELRIKIRKRFSRSAWRITLNFLEHFIPDSKREDFVRESRDIRDDWPHYFGRIVQSKGFSIKSFVFWSKEEISESKDKWFNRDHKNSTVKS